MNYFSTMPEPDNDQLRKLFQATGHHAPGTDLTARIMAQVAVTRIVKPVPVKPLIGTRGWVLIAAGLVAVIGVGMSGGGDAGPGWPQALAERLARIQLPKSEWPVWLAAGSGLALLFTALDTLLRRRQQLTER